MITKKWIQEEVFMKSSTWDTFTWLGKITLFPLIMITGWFMILCLIPLYPIFWLGEHHKFPKWNLKRKWDGLFIKYPPYPYDQN